MALKIRHIRFLNLFGFTHISGTIDIDSGGEANQKKCEEEKTRQLEDNRNLRINRNDKS